MHSAMIRTCGDEGFGPDFVVRPRAHESCTHAAWPHHGLALALTGVAGGDDATFNLYVEAPRV
jgi:hypothetical protein